MIRTPHGQPADGIEKVMLLSMWANHLQVHPPKHQLLNRKMILAGLGKPTYPIHTYTVKAYQRYWEHMQSQTEEWFADPEAATHAAIGYGDPYGDRAAKQKMARAMSNWYGSEITDHNVLFTVGGIGGLKLIFEVLNTLNHTKKYRVITPFPHYSAYANNPQHVLHPVDVLAEKGYRLTANSLEHSIEEAYRLAQKDEVEPKAVLLCNPSNPLGTIIEEEELNRIAEVLRRYPQLYFILDEAYAEMNFVPVPSFLKCAPDLKSRTIILRSATKALSAAGERMAVLLAFDEHFINQIVRHKINSYIHAPRSAQNAYAETMMNFSDEDRTNLAMYYKTKVDYVLDRLQAMGASMSCPHYRVDGTFYALGDFHELFGLPMPEESFSAISHTGYVRSGEDLAYYLLFNEALMLAPLSYFGMPTNSSILRITCSAPLSELQDMMDRLEHALSSARALRIGKHFGDLPVLSH